MDFHDPNNDHQDMGSIPAHSARPKPKPNPGGVRYRECLKNHAAAIGATAVDGCGEFTPAGDDVTIDALRCAACNCHRNFHRKEMETGAAGFPFPYYRLPVGYPYVQMGQPRMSAPLALTSTSGAEQDDVAGGAAGGSSGKKRFRTKFSEEQKRKMQAFAERVGWRIQKSYEGEVEKFCEENSIKRHVFKVWMHNNKLALGKQVLGQSPAFCTPPDPSSKSVDED